MSITNISPLTKILFISLFAILAATIIAIILGFILPSDDGFTLAYIFPVNFLAGAILICIALITLILPASFKPDKLTDSTTLMERQFDQRKEKQKKAYGFLFSGILVIVIAGVVELILWWVV